MDTKLLNIETQLINQLKVEGYKRFVEHETGIEAISGNRSIFVGINVKPKEYKYIKEIASLLRVEPWVATINSVDREIKYKQLNKK